MFKKIFVVIAFLAMGVAAHARQYTIAFKPDTAVTGRSAFDKVQFLDLRSKKDYVGSMALGYSKSGLVAETALDSMMEAFCHTMISPAKQRNSGTLVVALKHLIVEEKYNTQFSIGNIYLDADFYLGNNGQFVKVMAIDSLFEFALDGRNPIQTLSLVYSRIFSSIILSVSAMQVPGELPVPLDDVRNMDAIENRKFAVYTAEPRPGIYYTVSEFLNNTPGDTAFVQKHMNNFDVVTDWFFKKGEGKKKRGVELTDTICFAVYNGKKWYRPYQHEFKEMKFKEGNFYYLEKADGLILPSTNNYYMFFPGFGVVGGLAAVAVQASVQN
ncbi:MAG: hypothetical protein EOO01_41515, partial [Chitinophagaceae bacterium]